MKINDQSAKNSRNADLRTAFLLGFDSFSTTPVDVGNALGRNSRYGRELLEVLVNKAELMTDTYINGDGSQHVWQCNETYDSVDRATAEATIDRWLATIAEVTEEAEIPAPAKAAKKAAAKKTSNPANLPTCLCGCGLVANRGRNYKPGHDARHAGEVARYAAGRNAEERYTVIADRLPTVALRLKAQAMMLKLVETGQFGSIDVRKTAKAKKALADAAKAEALTDAAPVKAAGYVKKGRWTYPAVKDEAGVVWINRSRTDPGQGWDEVTNAKVRDSFSAE